MSASWNELVANAVLGTEHQPLGDLQADAEDLAPVLAGIKASHARNDRSILIRTAAVTDLYRRAGKRLSPRAVEIPPSTPDTFNCCNQKAASLLSQVIVEENIGLLQEWLAIAARYRKRPPHIMWPPLLELAASRKELRAPLNAVSGARVQWLVHQHADWQPAVITNLPGNLDDPKLMWETGELKDRLEALRSLRAADPDRARELMISTWKTDPGEQRISFIDTLTIGLSAADENFLEEVALQDRRKEIRLKAAQMLAAIPTSRLTERARAHLRGAITVTRNGAATAFELTLPREHTKEMERDGVIAGATGKLGQRAELMIQLIGLVDPDFFLSLGDGSIESVIAMCRNSDGVYKMILLHGLAAAAARHRKSRWAQYLLKESDLKDGLADLAECLTAECREELIAEYAARGASNQSTKLPPSVLYGILACEGTISFAGSSYLLALFRTECSGLPLYENPYAAALQMFALRIDPALAIDAQAGWREDAIRSSFVRNAIDQFINTVVFRQEMQSALSEQVPGVNK